jgi:hypothetical protein
MGDNTFMWRQARQNIPVIDSHIEGTAMIDGLA